MLINDMLLGTQSQEIALRLDQAREKAFEIGGQSSTSSPKQLQTILFDQMKLPVCEKTPSARHQPMKKCCKELALDYHYQCD